MLAPVRTVAPAAPPVSLVEAKAHLRVDFSDDDTIITSLIQAAADHLDGWTGVLGQALVTQTWRQDFRAFGCRMRLPLGPVQSIATVTYYDGENAQQTLSEEVCALFTDALGPYIDLLPGQSWPGSYDRPDGVSITFVAGYGDAAAVPATIKAAILMLVGHWYENREASVVGVSVERLPMAVDALLAPYRRVGV